VYFFPVDRLQFLDRAREPLLERAQLLLALHDFLAQAAERG
jgi:hypothetical protein